MKVFLKTAHILSLVLFLGSIFTYILISTMIENADVSDLAFGRSIISRGTAVLTLPALWVLVLSGVIMGINGEKGSLFFKIKLAAGILLLINAHVFVAAAVTSATSLALDAKLSGQLSPQYYTAYMKESAFGAVNVLLALSALVFTIRKKGR